MANTERNRLAASACAVGGALWVIVLMADVVAHGSVYGSAASYRVWESLLILVQALLLIGVVGLAWSGATGAGRLGRVGLWLALLGRTSFLLGELRSFAQGKDDDLLVPLGALVTGLGMLLVGVAVVRAQRWVGWHRMIPLLTGLYPFVAMFPIIAITGEPSALMIALWGLLWLPLGLALYVEAGVAGAPQRSGSASAYS